MEPREKLSVNLFDLDRIGPEMLAKLLAGRLSLDRGCLVRVDPKRGSELAAPFTCDTYTAGLICDILRKQDREAGDAPTRVYINRNGKWFLIPPEVMLILPQGDGIGRGVLNPLVFKSTVIHFEDVPLIPKRVELG